MKSELCLLFIFYIFSLSITGQISYGGKPLPLSADANTRLLSATQELFVEMPKFDAQAALWRSQQDKSEFKSLEFAHKFDVHLRSDNSGITFNYGNTKVWRVGIRSRGAYSLNILFSKFRLSEGAKVFVYNSDQSEILGSYTSENNSHFNLLPIQPIGGDEIIVEYHLPNDIDDEGELEIGEVNHDFVGIFRATEPRDPVDTCHPNLICYPEDIEAGSGVVALIINGTTYCTGSLVNNSSEDGTPYLLTATHCLNKNYDLEFLNNSRYNIVAGSIVAFFNYDSPVCSTDIRGPLQMTMASADSVLISEKHDISLLKFKQIPPKEYHPFYLGWNAGSAPSAPLHGIHHPNGGIKKVAIDEDPLRFKSLTISGYNADWEPNSFWEVGDWEVAATEVGSSGSPLLDRQKRIVGSLTGGNSYCSSPRGPDFYASLNKLWNVEGSLENPNPIKFYLDPNDTGTLQLNGLNPYQGESFTKSHNYRIEEKTTESYFNSVPMLATNNTYGYSEYAEEFYSKDNVQIHGVFVSSPAINNIEGMQIKLKVYTGEKGPESLIYELPYNYSYRYYSGLGFNYANRNMKYNIENYVEFEAPITLSGNFYISYSERSGVANGFSALNTDPRKLGTGIESTAWMKGSQGWVRSSENIENPINTSLLIAAYGIGDATVKNNQDTKKTNISVYYSGEVKRVFIESDDELLEWELYYVSGQKLYQERADKSINRASIQAAHMPKGVYIVRVKTANGTISRNKVLLY
jgi:hypothetical protein